MSKQKIREWLVDNTGCFYDDARVSMGEVVDIIHQYTKDQSAWVSELDELLMMFIADGYSASGKVSKKTAIKMMRFVGSRPKLQEMVNNSDKNGILSYKPSIPPTQEG